MSLILPTFSGHICFLPVDFRLQVLRPLIMNLLCSSPGCLGLWFWTKDASFFPLVIGMVVFWIKKMLVQLFFSCRHPLWDYATTNPVKQFHNSSVKTRYHIASDYIQNAVEHPLEPLQIRIVAIWKNLKLNSTGNLKFIKRGLGHHSFQPTFPFFQNIHNVFKFQRA